MKSTRINGFTLLELMVVVAIAAIMASIASPAMTSLVESNRLVSASNELYGSLVNARSEASARNQPVVVCKSTNGSSCTSGSDWEEGWLTYVDEDQDGSMDSGEPVLDVVGGLPTGISISVSAAFANEVTYSADGSLSDNGNFTVCAPNSGADDGKSLVLFVTGRPRSGTTSCL